MIKNVNIYDLVVVHHEEENTFVRGYVVENGPRFLTIRKNNGAELQYPISPCGSLREYHVYKFETSI